MSQQSGRRGSWSVERLRLFPPEGSSAAPEPKPSHARFRRNHGSVPARSLSQPQAVRQFLPNDLLPSFQIFQIVVTGFISTTRPPGSTDNSTGYSGQTYFRKTRLITALDRYKRPHSASDFVADAGLHHRNRLSTRPRPAARPDRRRPWSTGNLHGRMSVHCRIFQSRRGRYQPRNDLSHTGLRVQNPRDAAMSHRIARCDGALS